MPVRFCCEGTDPQARFPEGSASDPSKEARGETLEFVVGLAQFMFVIINGCRGFAGKLSNGARFPLLAPASRKVRRLVANVDQADAARSLGSGLLCQGRQLRRFLADAQNICIASPGSMVLFGM